MIFGIDILGCLGFILIIELLGGLSAWASGNLKTTYAQMKKPPLAPPAKLFGWIWPLLFILIGLYGYLIFNQARLHLQIIFCLQLLINFSWTIIFFKFRQYWLSSGLVLVLDCLVGILIYQTGLQWPLVALLLIPYFLWLLFATYLALGVAFSN